MRRRLRLLASLEARGTLWRLYVTRLKRRRELRWLLLWVYHSAMFFRFVPT